MFRFDISEQASADTSWLEYVLALDLATIFATFAAAGFGAWTAFRFEKSRRDQEMTAGQVADGNRLLFDLWNMHNDLAQFKKDVIDELPDKDPDKAWFLMKAIIYPFTAGNRLSAKRFQFLIDRGRSDIAADLKIERQRYELFVAQVSERSRIMREFVRPRWEAAGFTHGVVVPRMALITATGINHYAEMLDLTKNILNFIDEDIESTKTSFLTLRKYLSDTYPKSKFVQVQFEPDEDNGDG